MDKQAHPRSRGRLKVRYGVQTLNKTAFTMNVSLTGAFVRTNDVFKPGTTMQVEVETSKESTLSLWAQVVWAKKVPAQMAHILPCGMGIRFIHPPPEWQEFFTRWQAER
jgi:Tfp pilus assembly protein PilZ